MRRTPDERAARLQERILSALIECGGWLPRSALRLLAGQGEVYADELDRALSRLEAEGLVQSRAVDHFVGRHGGGTKVYRATVCTVIAGDVRKDGDVVLDLAPEDRVALLDVVHSQLVRVRESAEAHAEEQRWLRISSTLLAAELFDPTDRDAEAS